jgi:hypothetical protein
MLNFFKNKFFFAKRSTIKDAHTYAHTLTPMNGRTHPTSMSISNRRRRRTDPTGLEIDEVTMYTSLLTGTSPPTE